MVARSSASPGSMIRQGAGSLLVSGLATMAAVFCVLAKAADPQTASVPAQIESPSPAPSGPDQPSSQKAGETASEVIVQAERQALQRRVQGFVRRITQNPRYSNESLPRWRAPVCFAVAGLPTKEGLFVLDRLSRLADSVGARVARRGCRYNFYVVFTPEPDKLLKRVYRVHRGVFDDSDGVSAVQRFLSPPKPQAVRVWHNTTAVSKDGVPVGPEGGCGSIVVQGRQVPVSCQYSPSRITRYDVFGFSVALVVVDTTFPKTATLGQLTDFAAMVGLADIDIDADIGDAPSILQLFGASSDASPSGLTTWDQAFLSALYQADQSSVMQRSQIATRMVHDVSH